MKSLKYIVLSALILLAGACSKQSATSTANPSVMGDNNNGSGQGGSLARFTIAQNHLYIVDDLKLFTYSLANPAAPQLTSTVILGEDIETIYSYKDKLFIGSQNAMYVYSISDADNPDKLGTASHVRACDPVVADDTVAYVTVRTGNSCGGTLNALYVYDVRQVLNPQERNMLNIKSPWGLGMTGNKLYVCQGGNGLTVFDISNRYYPKLQITYADDTYYDVIPYDNLLICMVEGGVLLYEIQQNGGLVKMAKISS